MTSIVESSLIKKIKCLVLKHWLDGEGEALNVDLILSIAAANIYPFRNDIVVCKDNGIISQIGSIKDILDSVLIHCKKREEILSAYNYESLVLYFRNEWANKLTINQKKILCAGISIINEVGEDGYASLKGNAKIWNAIVNMGYEDLNSKYGVKAYDPNAYYNQHPIVKRKVVITTTSPKQISIVDEELNNFWKSNIAGDLFYEKMPFVWKLKISQSKYNELKEILGRTYAAYGSKKQLFLDNHSEKIFVYVAEWYRREYTARGGNGLKEISKNISAKDIFDNCPRWQNYVYSGETNDCWLYSMYALGGLPVRYSSYTLSVLYDKIFDAINGDSEALNSERNFNNTAFKESLEDNNGSLRLFVNSIVGGDLPFCDEDLELDEVKNFIERINEGHKRSRIKKYRFEWIVNYDGTSEYGDRRLRILFNPELPGELHGSISYSRMTKSWGITNVDNITSFHILCRINEMESFPLVNYSNQWNGYFVGWTTEDYVDVPRTKIPATYIQKIDILLNYQIDGKEITQIIQTEEYKSLYIQLYPTEEICEWSSIVNYGNRSAVAFHLPLQSDLSSEMQFSDNSENSDRYGWKEFVDNCILEDVNGKLYTLHRKGDSVEISPRLKSEIINYNQGMVKCVNKSEVSYIPLVIGIDGIEILQYEIDKEEPTPLKKNDYQLEYKTCSSSRYTEFVNPPQGLMTIRVITNNEQTAKLDVYYLPSTFSNAIKRNLQSHEIRFDNSICNVYHERVGELNSSFRDIDYSENINMSDPFNKYADEIVFRIGNSEEYIELPIYRPYIRKVLTFNGNPIYVTGNKDEVFSVAMINSDRMSVHVIDEHGKRVFPKQNVGFCDFDEEISWKDNNTNLVINNGNIKYNICDDNRLWGLDNGRIHVSREFRDQYRFFFWSASKWSDPEEVETQYDTNSEMLEIDRKHLSQTGILFQSLDGLTPPRYWKPVITHANRYADFASDINTQIKCFDIAVKHRVYFKIFEPLYKIIPVTGGLQDRGIVEFFFEYAKSKNYKLTDEEYNGLYRFADEFMFDWLFLARSEWITKTKERENRKLALELFRKNPKIKNKSILEQTAYAKIVDTYWSNSYPSKTDERWKPHGHKLETKAIKYMNSFLDKYEFTGKNRNYEISKDFLHDLYENENSFQLIFNKITEELFK